MDINQLQDQIIGPYRLVEQIGAGGMGVVYRAYQLSMNRQVAVKLLPMQLALEGGYIERFKREASLAARLQHPHIVTILDYGFEDAGVCWLSMNYLQGGSLEARLRKDPSLTLEEIGTLLRQLAEALDYAHAQNVIHRDIKPGNVLLDEVGNVYLGDFGIAKLLDATTLTNMQDVVTGTPAYMAPELASNMPIDARSDMYSLGVLIYRLMVGNTPFRSSKLSGLIYQHIHEPPVPPSKENPSLPPELDWVVLKALSKNPDDRYQTAVEMADDFTSVLNRQPKIRKPTGRPKRDPDSVTPMLAKPMPTGVSPLPGPATQHAPRARRAIQLLIVAAILTLGATATGLLIINQTGSGTQELPTAVSGRDVDSTEDVGEEVSPENTAEGAGGLAISETPRPQRTASVTPTRSSGGFGGDDEGEDPGAVLAIVQESSINIRSGPGIDYPVLVNAFEDETLRVISRYNVWLLVLNADGQLGWVSASVTDVDTADALVMTTVPTPLSSTVLPPGQATSIPEITLEPPPRTGSTPDGGQRGAQG